MLWPLLATALLAPAGTTLPEPIAAARQQFEQLDSYRVTVRSSAPHTRQQVARYTYRKPGFVRMEFVTPHAGALMIYNPHSGKVRLWPFGHPGFALTLAPDNPLIRGPHGHRIDRSHVGMLLQAVQILQAGGDTTLLGESAVGHWTTQGWSITGAPGKTVAGVHRFQLWLAKGTQFPVKVVSFDLDGELLETVLMDDVEVDVALPADFFQP
jgi:outer membrane lipoprotein-sorting protein